MYQAAHEADKGIIAFIPLAQIIVVQLSRQKSKHFIMN